MASQQRITRRNSGTNFNAARSAVPAPSSSMSNPPKNSGNRPKKRNRRGFKGGAKHRKPFGVANADSQIRGKKAANRLNNYRRRCVRAGICASPHNTNDFIMNDVKTRYDFHTPRFSEPRRDENIVNDPDPEGAEALSPEGWGTPRADNSSQSPAKEVSGRATTRSNSSLQNSPAIGFVGTGTADDDAFLEKDFAEAYEDAKSARITTRSHEELMKDIADLEQHLQNKETEYNVQLNSLRKDIIRYQKSEALLKQQVKSLTDDNSRLVDENFKLRRKLQQRTDLSSRRNDEESLRMSDAYSSAGRPLHQAVRFLRRSGAGGIGNRRSGSPYSQRSSPRFNTSGNNSPRGSTRRYSPRGSQSASSVGEKESLITSTDNSSSMDMNTGPSDASESGDSSLVVRTTTAPGSSLFAIQENYDNNNEES